MNAPVFRLLIFAVPTLLLSAILALTGCGGPSGPEGHNHAGVEHFEDGRLEEAIAEYSEAIRLDHEYAAAFYNRGQTYFTLGQAKLAIQDYDEAIRLSPDRPELPLVHASRAMAYTLLGEDEEALRDIGRAVELGYDARRLVAAIDALKDQR